MKPQRIAITAGASGIGRALSSNAGLFGCPLRAPYVASKWALIGLTRTLAMELGPDGITEGLWLDLEPVR